MSDLDDAIERLNPDASPKHLYRGPSSTADVEDDLRLVIAAARERDALSTVIEVIDWVEQNLAGEDSPAWARSASCSMLSIPAAMDVVDSAREHFGLTKGVE